jgi:hypothetical protein
MISEKPPVEWDLPDQIRRLRHFHVAGVRGKIHGANAKSGGVRHGVNFRVQRDALRQRVMHAFLHEAAMMVVLHAHLRLGGFFLRPSQACRQQTHQQES